MLATMYEAPGIGLAATQLGVMKRIMVMDCAGKDEPEQPMVLLNPEILWASEETETSEEGCLSIPEIYLKVKRPMRARVRAMGLDGQMFECEGEGLLARCLLHENDHLTGTLLVDFVGPLKRQMIRKKLQKAKSLEEADVEA
jgi:peptide deformylase